MSNERAGLKTRALYLIPILLILSFLAAPVAFANSISFNDLTLTKSNIGVYELGDDGNWTYVQDLNSTDTFYLDPNANYVMVFKPDTTGVYSTSPMGVLQFIADNGETILGAGLGLILLLAFVGALWRGLIK